MESRTYTEAIREFIDEAVKPWRARPGMTALGAALAEELGTQPGTQRSQIYEWVKVDGETPSAQALLAVARVTQFSLDGFLRRRFGDQPFGDKPSGPPQNPGPRPGPQLEKRIATLESAGQPPRGRRAKRVK